MEETTESDDLGIMMVTNNPSERLPPVRYEAEDLEDDGELFIALFCQMTDLNNIKSYLEDLWGSHNQGTASLVVTSVVTNDAPNLVISIDDKIHERFPQLTGYWETFVNFFLGVSRRARDSVPEPSNIEANLQDWIFLDAYMAPELQVHYLDPRVRDEHNETLEELRDFIRMVNEMSLYGKDPFLEMMVRKGTLVAANHFYVQELFWTFATCKADLAGSSAVDTLLVVMASMYTEMKESHEVDICYLDNTPSVFAFQVYLRARRILGNAAISCCEQFKSECELLEKVHGKEQPIQNLLSIYLPEKKRRSTSSP